MTSDKQTKEAQFTRRLEAFSDLVFGLSLSLLATNLDVPAQASEIFASTRWVSVIATFAIICRLWLEHYRVFRHDFVVQGLDIAVNFVFLFSIAILPYSVQVFLKFENVKGPFTLYMGNLSLVFVTLSLLRVSSLRQRRGDDDEADRLKGWKSSLTQCTVALLVAVGLVMLHSTEKSVREATRHVVPYLLALGVILIGCIKFKVKQLPAFLNK